MSNPTIRVTDFERLDGRRLRLSFSDGTSGEVDMTTYLDDPKLGPVFAPLRDDAEFARVYLDGGTVCWPSGLDVAPEALFALAHGLPRPKTYEDAKENELTVSLRELRRMAGVTQVQLGERLDVSQPELSRLEGQREDSRLSTIRKYLAALGWDLEVAAVQGDKRVRLRGV